MADFSELFVGLFAIAPNGVLPTLKLEKAVKAAGLVAPPGQSLDHVAADMGNSLRMVASHYRAARANVKIRDTMERKASHVV